MATISLENAFSNRLEGPSISDENLSRIVNAYRLATEAQKTVDSVYQVSKEWVQMYKFYMGDFIATMQSGDMAGIRSMLSNFFREKFSNGLHGFTLDMADRYMNPRQAASNEDLAIYMKNVVNNIDVLAKNCPKLNVNRLNRPNIGNPYGYEIDGIFVTVGADYHYYFSQKISMLLRNQGNARVMEIGGGFGGLAYFLGRDMSNCRYTDFDLPENLAIASFFLMSAFPQKRVGLFGEVDIGTCDINAYDFVMMPNFELRKIPANCMDLAFNSYSLSEMSFETISNYVATICRATTKVIYHANHADSGNHPSADTFPIDYQKFSLLFRAPLLWNKGATRVIDEHEFIYINKVLL